MKLLNLAARVSNTFSLLGSDQLRTVQKVKNNTPRDVVTHLDMKLHQVSASFVSDELKACRLLSEEGVSPEDKPDLASGEWLIVDPLDGSSNYAVGMPNYGYMAAHVRDGKSIGTVIVLPEHNQYLVEGEGNYLTSQPIPNASGSDIGTVYYAYPPKQDESARQSRIHLLNLIDEKSAGMHRYGSACAGLYQFLCGKHKAFIGHQIRIWDALAFIPILARHQIEVKYQIDGLFLTIVAGFNKEFIELAADILNKHQNISLQIFENNEIKFS